jgi:hypothetical protein
MFVVGLLPGFLQFAFYYWFVADRGSVPYAHQLVRQTLDVYRCGGGSGDRSNSIRRPAVVFCPGD